MEILSEQTVAEARDELTTVRKAVVDFGRENVAGIKLTIRSSSEQPITVQVVEALPGHVSMADVQVHPAYHPEKWTYPDGSDRMVFETDVPPWGEVETVYGIRASFDELDPFTGEPSIAVARGLTDDDGGSDQDNGSSGGDHDSARPGNLAEAEPVGGGSTDAQDDQPPEEPKPPDGSHTPTDGAGDQAPSYSEPASTTTQGTADPNGGVDRGVPGTPTAGSRATGRSAGDPFVYRESQPRPGSSRGQGDTEGGMNRRSAREPATGETAAASPDAVATFIEALTRTELTETQRDMLRVNLGLAPTPDEGRDHPELRSAAASLETLAQTAEQLHDKLASPDPAVDELATAFDRLAGLVDQLGSATKETVDEQAALQGRIEGLERELARLQETYATVERLDARVSSIEETFDADETAAIGEVIAAEQRWRRHRDRVSSP